MPTIRYYEQVGLMPSPPRTDGQQRRYGDAEVARLNFIRHARELGFEVDAIRELLAMSAQPEESCAEVDRLARRHLAEVEQRITRLIALRTELQRMVTECGHGRVGECRVIQVLADHGEMRPRPWRWAAGIDRVRRGVNFAAAAEPKAAEMGCPVTDPPVEDNPMIQKSRPLAALLAAGFTVGLAAGPALASPCSEEIARLETRVKDEATGAISASTSGKAAAGAREGQGGNRAGRQCLHPGRSAGEIR